MTEADLINAYNELATRSDDGFTTEELMAKTGLGVHKARAVIRSGIAKKLLYVGRRLTTNILGVQVRVPVYVRRKK